MIRKLFILLFLIVSCSSPPSDYSRVKVVRVIDGDTVRLSDGRLVRYIGVDTPEVRVREGGEWAYRPQPFAIEAAEFNRRLVEDQYARIEFDAEVEDKYGRLLGYCFVGDVFVNEEILKEGYGVILTIPPNLKYVDRFIAAQKQAREERKGLWGSYVVITGDEAGRHINQIRTVRGKVMTTYKSNNCVFLNFGHDRKKDFTAVIFNRSLDAFYAKNITPERFYKNKIVEVTGRIKQHTGPEIIIDFPDQIKVVE